MAIIREVGWEKQHFTDCPAANLLNVEQLPLCAQVALTFNVAEWMNHYTLQKQALQSIWW